MIYEKIRKSCAGKVDYPSVAKACWKTGGPGDLGYTQKGTKKKGNRTVPNCVPKAGQK